MAAAVPCFLYQILFSVEESGDVRTARTFPWGTVDFLYFRSVENAEKTDEGYMQDTTHIRLSIKTRCVFIEIHLLPGDACISVRTGLSVRHSRLHPVIYDDKILLTPFSAQTYRSLLLSPSCRIRRSIRQRRAYRACRQDR